MKMEFILIPLIMLTRYINYISFRSRPCCKLFIPLSSNYGKNSDIKYFGGIYFGIDFLELEL